MDDDETTVEKVARDMVERYGEEAPKLLHERAEVAEKLYDKLVAKAWRDIADIAERRDHS